VDEHPAPFAADCDGDRFHAPVAAGLSVAGDVAVEVPGPQAAGAVIAMRCAGRVERDLYAAVSTSERAGERQVW
jgi:hypothetical protein